MLFFRRSLEIRAGTLEPIVYTVKTAPGAKQDPVPALGAFPEHWRPTPRAGEVFFDRESIARYYTCQVPRSQFRHYQQLTAPEALELYPEIEEMIVAYEAEQVPAGFP
jgi:hypothetical protein